MDDVVVTGKLKLKKSAGATKRDKKKPSEFPSWAPYAVDLAKDGIATATSSGKTATKRAHIDQPGSSKTAAYKKTKAEVDKESWEKSAQRLLRKVIDPARSMINHCLQVAKTHERKIDELNWQLEDTPLFNELPRINPIKETGY